MTKLNLLATAGGAFALALVARTGASAPINQATDATLRAATTLGAVEQVHGCNRLCRLGWVPRWGVVRLHRHVGPACRPVRC